jgi:hypothetical protein
MTNIKNVLVWLYENNRFKIYSHCEYTYLKDKESCKFLDDWEKDDDNSIGWIYGEPTDALIFNNNRYAVVVGSGIYIYDIDKRTLEQFYNEPDNILWINAVYQDDTFDDKNKEFRIVAYENDSSSIYKFDIEKKQLEKIK